MPTITLNPVSASLVAVSNTGTAVFQLGGNSQPGLVIAETNTLLTHQLVSGTLDWGDGSPILDLATLAPPLLVNGVQSLAKVSGSITVNQLSHPYGPGNFNVTVWAQNYATPVPAVSQQTVNVVVTGLAQQQPTALGAWFGPILPRDAGYPNVDQWSFNVSSNVGIIESSVKMLLTTRIGDRLANPTYGTNITKFIFEPNTPALQGKIQQEIITALNAWEPRASLSSFSLTRSGTAVLVVAQFVSNTGQNIQVGLTYTPPGS